MGCRGSNWEVWRGLSSLSAAEGSGEGSLVGERGEEISCWGIKGVEPND